jgi:hypothetical protein
LREPPRATFADEGTSVSGLNSCKWLRGKGR